MPIVNRQTENEIEIRRARIDDISTIIKIEKNSYPNPWSVKMFERELQLEFSNFFAAIQDHEIAGYICFWTVSDEGQITNITVKEKFRRKGLGSGLMKYIMDISYAMKIKKMFLEVRANNYPAFKLYEKFGFKKIGVRKKYYSNSDDAVVMAKTL
ncbi:MAG: ribosomal protein S18-alanine N-acetyltransferase [Elusimicrobiota bacterium]|nr:ribosomal protein S18-alanine N-acetyltransferase [Elusimicrobiota bacterium]